MKKFITICFLTIIILVTFTFTVFKVLSLGPSDNFFNRNLREKFSSYPILRKVFSLHFDGDAKSDYLSSRYSEIFIEADSLKGMEISPNVLQRFTDKVQEITGKPTKFIYSDEQLLGAVSVSNKELEQLIADHRDYQNTNRAASLYVLLVGDNDDNPDLIGSTLNESGIVVFENSLLDFTRTNPELFDSYLYSTMLHEFGHQLGLDHNSEPNCLMNEEADQRSLFFQNVQEVITDFCPFEKTQLEQIKARL